MYFLYQTKVCLKCLICYLTTCPKSTWNDLVSHTWIIFVIVTPSNSSCSRAMFSLKSWFVRIYDQRFKFLMFYQILLAYIAYTIALCPLSLRYCEIGPIKAFEFMRVFRLGIHIRWPKMTKIMC